MYHEFSNTLCRFGLWHDAEPVLLAVSGGIDSMCMADLFRRTGLPFAVAHCNFHLRGAESDADEAMVEGWAADAGTAFFKADFDTVSFARENGVSIEMAARELRYRWFVKLCRTRGYKALCVAHNANDNAETLFLNLVRGTGLRGLSGMSSESAVPYSDDGGAEVRLLRPLLSFTRTQIEGYVRRHSIPFREDSTNAGTDYRRNRIRHLVFPVFEQMNPSFIRTVSDEIRWFSQAEAVADTYYESVISAAECRDGDDVILTLDALKSIEHWEYVLYRFLDRFGFNREAVVSLSELLKSGRTVPGKRFESRDHVLLTASGRLIVRKKSASDFIGHKAARKGTRAFPGNVAGPDPETREDIFTVIRGEGTYHCNGTAFSVSVKPVSGLQSLRQPSGTIVFDAARLEFPFVCRVWREGDWFIPFGMKGRKKVSDFFTDLKYDVFRKAMSVMVVDTASSGQDENRIAAVLGERIDDRYRVSSGTSSVVVIRSLTEKD